jgi:hypothetical protein
MDGRLASEKVKGVTDGLAARYRWSPRRRQREMREEQKLVGVD